MPKKSFVIIIFTLNSKGCNILTCIIPAEQNNSTSLCNLTYTNLNTITLDHPEIAWDNESGDNVNASDDPEAMINNIK